MRKKLECLITFIFVFLLTSPYTQAEGTTIGEYTKKSLSVLPILMYDTDIGVGYGGKAKFVNYLRIRESFDFIIFNSSKGERWYVFTFSIPDFEIRQGKEYGLSFDFRAEYDKYIKYYFYGTGIDSQKDDGTEFKYEKMLCQLTLGRGFSPHFVLEASYSLKKVRYFDVQPGTFTDQLNAVGDQFSPYLSLSLRYDTSDSQIHPKKGVRALFQNDVAADFLGNKNANFYRFTLDVRNYFLVFGRNDVFASRLLFQSISGRDIPLYELPLLGGGGTMEAMRGYRLSRFADKAKILFNAEYRFPLFWRIGGNLFVDTGTVFPCVCIKYIKKFFFDAGCGLRLYLPDFVARFDLGFSREGIGIYFNFGHIF